MRRGDPEEVESAYHLGLPAGPDAQMEFELNDHPLAVQATLQTPVRDSRQHDHLSCPGPHLK